MGVAGDLVGIRPRCESCDAGFAPVDSYTLPLAVAVRRDLPPSAKVIFAILYTQCGPNNHVWPGYRRLSRDAGARTCTVGRSLRRLEKLGLIIIYRGRRGQVYQYRIPSLQEEVA